jgi:hypothetical protein
MTQHDATRTTIYAYVIYTIDVHESVYRDTIMKVTNKMQLYWLTYFIFLCQLYMFRAMFSPIIRSTRLYLQHLVVFTQVATGWYQPAATWVLQIRSSAPDDGRKPPETCRADKEK